MVLVGIVSLAACANPQRALDIVTLGVNNGASLVGSDWRIDKGVAARKSEATASATPIYTVVPLFGVKPTYTRVPAQGAAVTVTPVPSALPTNVMIHEGP